VKCDGLRQASTFFVKADHSGIWSVDLLWAMMAGGLSWSVSIDRRA
jgi:hypothetical protein